MTVFTIYVALVLANAIWQTTVSSKQLTRPHPGLLMDCLSWHGTLQALSSSPCTLLLELQIIWCVTWSQVTVMNN